MFVTFCLSVRPCCAAHRTILSGLIGLLLTTAAHAQASFAEFDRRAHDGERLTVVFFGASLTWGANASDPQLTSFRGEIAKRLGEKYPKAPFTFYDAAIGGTGSQLGVFRLDRDVLSRQPDLVFLDFSANDDIGSAGEETLASYEAIVRRILMEAKAPVVQVIFPFKWNVERGNLKGMPRREAHLVIAKTYGAACGDAIALAQERVAKKVTTIDNLWPVDGVHPGDAGYKIFADAGWAAFENAVAAKLVCQPPAKMLHGETYMKSNRVQISSLGELPSGWKVGAPNVVSAYFDMLMSRWLDDETIAVKQADRLKVKFNGSMVMLFGESTPKSCVYRIYLDGKLVERKTPDGKQTLTDYNAGHLGKLMNGNSHHAQVIVEGLDTTTDHTLEIEPIFPVDKDEELRLESICVAGGRATIQLFSE